MKPMESQERPTNTSRYHLRDFTDKETVMGKWVDASNTDDGVAKLNNGCLGFDARDDVMRISAIRGPLALDLRIDDSQHRFGYSIFPHRGGRKERKVEFQPMEFNSPVLASRCLYSMKQLEGFYETDAILRFFECQGRGDMSSCTFRSRYAPPRPI